MITEIHYIMEKMHVFAGLHASTILKHFLGKLTQEGKEKKANRQINKKTKNNQPKKPPPKKTPHQKTSIIHQEAQPSTAPL